MFRLLRLTLLLLTPLILLATLASPANAQRRAVPRHPTHPERAVVVRGQVFIGGYFYDPFFGPYPWWHRTAYPYWYFPVYDNRGEVRLKIAPEKAEDAAVYVDGFYAGVVDDFNGVFQSLPLPPGGHTIVLFLEGYRTLSRNIYLRAGSTFTLRDTMHPLQPGETSERPDVAPPVPAPPPGSYRTPVTPPRSGLPTGTSVTTVAVGFGTLDLYVQPSDAQVAIDGQSWATSERGHFVVQVPVGRHRVEVTKPGYRPFAADVEIREGESRALNVSLVSGT